VWPARLIQENRTVNDRFTRGILVIIAIVLVLFVARPYFDQIFFAASTPRAVESRGQ